MTCFGRVPGNITETITMVADGILYAVLLAVLGALAAALGGPLWALPEVLLAAFVLYFFRDPDRTPPAEDVIVSPADGRVVDVRETEWDGQRVWKISVFLNIFNVHVNRSPIAGVIRKIEYCKGSFLVASRPEASIQNEQNTVTIEGERFTVVFKQIAGLIARRIVFSKKVGDRVGCGERVGLIKFGSRVDVFFPLDVPPKVAIGDKVQAGVSILGSPAQARESCQPSALSVQLGNG